MEENKEVNRFHCWRNEGKETQFGEKTDLFVQLDFYHALSLLLLRLQTSDRLFLTFMNH